MTGYYPEYEPVDAYRFASMLTLFRSAATALELRDVVRAYLLDVTAAREDLMVAMTRVERERGWDIGVFVKPPTVDLVNDYSLDGLGWARFSADRAYRYRIGRILSPKLIAAGWQALHVADSVMGGGGFLRIVFLMLNPSTADAFKVDPTVRRCVNFAVRWGADVVEVVNLFAFRSPDPADLRDEIKLGRDPIGVHNDEQILAACIRAQRVIAAWGTNGALLGRAELVRQNLEQHGVKLECLGRVPSDGSPMHPLARGKLYIPDDREPVAWP